MRAAPCEWSSKAAALHNAGALAETSVVFVVALALLATRLGASDVVTTNAPKFLGANSCSSSGCHGGGGDNQDQYLVWSLRDFHSQRPVATLTTARSKQIGDALQIKDTTADNRCTACHAPLQSVPAALRGEEFRVTEGVSCESCHGPSENWLRSHTRSDFAQADRTASGLRDLKNLYVRANTCVACHQTVSLALLKAGHPELMFELDGQSVSQPKHWRERADSNGGQTWLVGQAAALREMSWQLSREGADEKLVARWRALLWLLQKLDGTAPDLATLESVSPEPSGENLLAALNASDRLAKHAADRAWTRETSQRLLRDLAALGEEFENGSVSPLLHARRGERLVLALERLWLASGNAKTGTPADKCLNRLFQLTQSIPDFRPASFAEALKDFSAAL